MLKKHLFVLAIAATAGLAPLAANAEEYQDTRWYVAPYGTYVRPGGDRDAKDGWGGGLGIGKMLNQHFNVELRGFYQGLGGYTDGGASGRWDMTGGTADIQYYLMRGKFSPYTVIGAGAMNTSVPGNSGVGIIGEAGAGATYEIMDNLLVRGDVRYRYNNNLNAHLRQGTDEFHDMVVNLGFVVPFGSKHVVAAAAPAPVVETPVADTCATQDSDADGVSNCEDRCPSTLAGSKVDAYGCPLKLELKGVNFRVDSAELTPNAKAILDGVADNLIAYPQKGDIEVHGHTSSEGSDSHNMRLSKRRSQSVARYLQQRGVSNRLIAKGFGESTPIADNSTQEGREANRRVELVWIGD